MSEALRVAVVGAGRIGRQHAKWYRQAGCQVVGFLGSTPASVERTAAALAALLDTPVPGYTDFERLVAETRPEAVSICSPHHRHGAHALQAIAAGVPVFCEKPLVWDEGKAPAQIQAEAQSLLAAAERRGVLLGMNAQYTAAIPLYREWYERERGPWGRVERVEAVMQSRGRAGAAEYAEIWVDLASHPLSLVLKWIPGARLDPASVRCTIRQKAVEAEFRVFAADGAPCECAIHLGNVPEGPIRRCFGVNGFLLDYEGRNDAQGVFRTYLRQGETVREYPDFLYSSIVQFARAVRGEAELPIPAAEAYRNLELQIQILASGNVIKED